MNPESKVFSSSPSCRLRPAAEASTTVSFITKIIHHAITSDVPVAKPSPFTKKWWTKELSDMREHEYRPSSYAYRFRHVADHPSRLQYRQCANKSANKIRRAKKEPDVPPDATYPDPLSSPKFFIRDQIRRKISTLSPMSFSSNAQAY